MSINPIGDPVLTPDMIHTISDAATTLARADHFLKHGTVYERKLANECREQCKKLEAIIDLEHRRHAVKADTARPA